MITIEVRGIDQAIEGARDRIQRGKRAGLLSAGMRLVGVIQNELIPHEKPEPVDQGHYRAAWHAEPTEQGSVVYNDSPHAPVIEYGARAANIFFSRKLIDALAEWVVRKGLTGKGPGSIDKRAKEDEPRNIAFAIAQSMKKRGIFNRDDRGGLRIAEKARKRAPRIMAEEIAAEIHEATKGG